MGCCPPTRPPDDRAVVAAAIRVCALVLVEIRSSAGALAVACRRLPAAIPACGDGLSGAGVPLGPLTGVVPLSG